MLVIDFKPKFLKNLRKLEHGFLNVGDHSVYG